MTGKQQKVAVYARVRRPPPGGQLFVINEPFEISEEKKKESGGGG